VCASELSAWDTVGEYIQIERAGRMTSLKAFRQLENLNLHTDSDKSATAPYSGI